MALCLSIAVLILVVVLIATTEKREIDELRELERRLMMMRLRRGKQP